MRGFSLEEGGAEVGGGPRGIGMALIDAINSDLLSAFSDGITELMGFCIFDDDSSFCSNILIPPAFIGAVNVVGLEDFG